MSVNTVTSNVLRVSRFVNRVVFGKKHLLLTNALISTAMGAAGDAIQQNYDLMSTRLEQQTKWKLNDGSKGPNDEIKTEVSTDLKYNRIRTGHMSAAGLTTGLLSHYWYIWLDKFYGPDRILKVVFKKVLLDQILLSPINLIVYFTTVGILERAKVSRIKDEIVEKGMENIYIVEWVVWPPAQFINFLFIPLKYRLLFDNFISLGFDIYSPFVKYKTQLKAEIEEKKIDLVIREEKINEIEINEVKFDEKSEEGKEMLNQNSENIESDNVLIDQILLDKNVETKKSNCEICNNNECQIS